MNALVVVVFVAGHSSCLPPHTAPAHLLPLLLTCKWSWLCSRMCQRDERYLPTCLPACCLVGIFGLHCIAQIPYLLSMLIAQNCTKVLTFVTHRKLAFHMPHTTAATVPHYSALSALSLPASILRIFQLQFAQLFNDKLPNVSDSTSNYAIVCSVRQALPSPVPLECPIRMAF